MSRLSDIVAVVTGASRGAGRGIAAALGDAGATVYVTGRSSEGGVTTEGRSETIEETAELVSARGGHGIAVRTDHSVASEVLGLLERVVHEHRRIDVLVNNAWGGYERYGEAPFVAPFWEQPFERRWEAMFVNGLRAHMLTTRLAAPLMIKQGKGVIISTTAWDRDLFLGSLYYDVAKAAIVRASKGAALQLRPHGVASVAVAAGFMRTERVAEAVDANERTESPEYIGRAVVALTGDADVMRHSGTVVTVGDLAVEYGFTDIDGRIIPPFRLPDEDRFRI